MKRENLEALAKRVLGDEIRMVDYTRRAAEYTLRYGVRVWDADWIAVSVLARTKPLAYKAAAAALRVLA